MLRNFLFDDLDSITKSTPCKSTLPEWVLREAIEGLDALLHGEAQPIFTAATTKDHGVTPFLAKKYRMKAAVFYYLLRKKGYTRKKAISKVRRAYGKVSGSTIDSWGQKYGHIPWLNFIKKEMENSHWNEQQLVTKMSEAGKYYQQHANKKKKAEKSDPKSAAKKPKPTLK
jgi:hypothetical protein